MARGAVPVVPAPAPPGTTSVWVRSNGMPVVTTKIAATNTAIPTTPEVMRWFRRWRSRRRSSRSEAGWGTGMRREMRSSVGSGLFLIMILHRGFQGRSSVRSERADGGGRDPEELGCVLAPKIEEIHEHERGALALRELAERADDLVAEVGGGEGVLRLTGAQGPFRRPLQPAEPAPRRVEGRPIQVPGRVVDAVPSLEHLHEGVLHQLLSLVGVPDDEVEGSVEPLVLVGEQVLERQRLGYRLRINLLGET